MPIPFLLAVIGAGLMGGLIGGGIAALAIGLLGWDTIEGWFNQDKVKKLAQADKDNVAIIIKEEMKKGKVPVIQGIFDTSTEEFLEATRYEAEELDADLRRQLRTNEPLVYEYADSSSYYEDTSYYSADHSGSGPGDCNNCGYRRGSRCEYYGTNIAQAREYNCGF